MISSQMLKGTLEGCVLEVISRKETYGYEILETLRGMALPRFRREPFIQFFYVWKRIG